MIAISASAMACSNTDAEKAAIKEGRVPEAWQTRPAKLRQKDCDARWSAKYTKAKVKEGTDPKAFKPVDLAIPMFAYKNHIAIDRAHGLIRTWDASAANAHDGARLPELVSKNNTGSGVWVDTPIAQRKTKSSSPRACSPATSITESRRAGRCPSVSRAPTPSAPPYDPRSSTCSLGRSTAWGWSGIARARIKIGMANLAYNFQRLAWLGRTAPA